MNTRIYRSKALFPAILLFIIAFSSIVQANSIEGYVYDYNRNALTDIDVELRDDDGRTRLRTRTDAIGRYRFSNLKEGRYFIKAFPFRLNLRDQEETVVIQSINLLGGDGSQTFQQDLVLKLKKGALADTTNGVVFAQKVPSEAQKHFDDGVKLLAGDRRKEGFAELIKAVETFPTYYAALNKVGAHLLYRKRYLEAASMFVRAVEVNPKSSNSFYYMGIAFSKLGSKYQKAALVAFTNAGKLAPNAHQVQFELGKLHKKMGNYVEAEASYIKAKKLSDGFPQVHLLLSQLYANDLKQYGKAADELEKYLKTSKNKDSKLKAKVADLRAKAKKQKTS